MLAPGSVEVHRVLGSEARYRVVAIDGAITVLEVVDAPGLAAQTRIRVMTAAVLRMRPELDPATVSRWSRVRSLRRRRRSRREADLVPGAPRPR